MKVNYNLSKLSVEFDGETVRDVWKQIAVFQEVFGESACGILQRNPLNKGRSGQGYLAQVNS